MFSTFFKLNKHKRYNYTPRYYDERKERLENLKKKYSLIADDTDAKRFRQINFRDQWKQNYQIKGTKNTRIRLLVILAFLLLVAYLTIDYIGILF